jgi:hypothetical protein
MERALLTLLGRENRARVYGGLAETAGVRVSPRGTWLLYRIADSRPITEVELSDLLGITEADLAGRLKELVAAGYVTVGAVSPAEGDGSRPGADLMLTPAGDATPGSRRAPTRPRGARSRPHAHHPGGRVGARREPGVASAARADRQEARGHGRAGAGRFCGLRVSLPRRSRRRWGSPSAQDGACTLGLTD